MGLIKGDKIRIRPNLSLELARIGFKNMETFIEKFVGTEQEVLDLYTDENTGEQYVTIDLCCEIPKASCRKLKNDTY